MRRVFVEIAIVLIACATSLGLAFSKKAGATAWIPAGVAVAGWAIGHIRRSNALEIDREMQEMRAQIADLRSEVESNNVVLGDTLGRQPRRLAGPTAEGSQQR